jgi:hypothetical protein
VAEREYIIVFFNALKSCSICVVLPEFRSRKGETPMQGKQVKWQRNLALPLTIVYRKVDPDSIAPESFEFPQGGKLASDNRWVMMANLIPWSEFESEYAENFAKSLAAPAQSFRMALGSLIIKNKLGTSDRETASCKANSMLFLRLKLISSR